jgi:predicted DNA-binding transcriptional regulator YafY
MRELAWHLFSWGDQVEIVAPERLKVVMGEALQAAQAALGRTR